MGEICLILSNCQAAVITPASLNGLVCRFFLFFFCFFLFLDCPQFCPFDCFRCLSEIWERRSQFTTDDPDSGPHWRWPRWLLEAIRYGDSGRNLFCFMIGKLNSVLKVLLFLFSSPGVVVHLERGRTWMLYQSY